MAKITAPEVFIKLSDIKCRMAFSVKATSFYSDKVRRSEVAHQVAPRRSFKQNLVSEIQNHPPQAKTGRLLTALDFIILINKIIHFLTPSELSKLNVLKTLHP